MPSMLNVFKKNPLRWWGVKKIQRFVRMIDEQNNIKALQRYAQ
jgi:hypothetical protein